MDNPESINTPTRRTLLAATAGVVATPLIAGSAANAAPATDSTTGGHHDDGPGRPETRQAPDRDLRALLRELDQRRIQATVEKLVSFGTRHTLSVQDDPVRGIGAARDWIFATLQSYAAASGGRMTVEKQS